MSYNVIVSPNFDRELKRLSKKYKSLKIEVMALGEQLSDNPTMGTPIGRDCYKIRLAIKSKGTGKSGGARVITCVVALNEAVTLLTIYDKSDQADISDGELKRILKENQL
ncbi:MAG: type II toxin-antitoxin system RelE/ParE family toxin [Spirosomaceae bacterium]|jgi:mRNA-degrading endonuclease RelE of RelBE toxin-antitoxin system|nr:type II toxin-antitoxin system RelE/ParE family toxin [Spirosomataceae bacterium]